MKHGTRLLACVLLAGAITAGCSDGTNGPAGPTGPAGSAGPAGPTGGGGASTPVVTLDARAASAIVPTITGVSGTASQPTVSFRLAGPGGEALKGLPASAIYFTAAKLVPGTGGASAQWVSYINRAEQPTTGVGWGTTAQRQANSEAASASGATFVDNGDGTYTYKFSKDFGQYTAANNPGPGPAVAFDGALTHRIGFEIRGTGLNATRNPVWTYVPATGSTTTLPARYDVVNTAECAACHDKLAFHGGPRTDVQYCVTCHNPGTVDAQSGGSLDMKVMVHKIHRGIELPTVANTRPNPALPPNKDTNWPDVAPAQGKGYTIWGYGNTLWNFNHVEFTQDQRYCTTCHRESDTSTPQASNWRTTVNSTACGACHDNVNFATGANHGGVVATDAECATCHGPNSNLSANGKPLRTELAHKIPEIELANTISFEVLRIEPASGTPACAANVKGCKVEPGTFPKVTIRVRNPQTSTNYLLTDPMFTTNLAGTTRGSVTVRIGYTTQNYGNINASGARSSGISITFVSNGTVPAAVTRNPDDTYTATATTAIPAVQLVGGTGVVFMEGRAIANVAPAGQTAVFARIPVESSDPIYFPISDATAVARRQITDVAKCNQCHGHLDLVHGTRNDQVELCAVCHSPLYGGSSAQATAFPLDLKYLAHAIHAGNLKIGTSLSSDFTTVGYPGSLANCEGCHRPDTYYPVDQTKYFGSTVFRGALSTPDDDLSLSTNVAACSGCHNGRPAMLHMKQNGGAVMLPNDATGLLDPTTLTIGENRINNAIGAGAPGATAAPAETCATCHGPGATADVKKAHDVASYTFR